MYIKNTQWVFIKSFIILEKNWDKFFIDVLVILKQSWFYENSLVVDFFESVSEKQCDVLCYKNESRLNWYF